LYLHHLRDHGLTPDILAALAQVEFSMSIVSPDAEDTHGRKALEWINQAIALEPNVSEYHFLYGQLLEHVLLDYQAAADAYRRALQLEPLFIPALDGLAALCGVPEDVVSLEEGISCYEQAVRMSPTRSRWLRLGQLYTWAGRQADGEQALSRGLTAALETAITRY
jgi:tetratricopeptide (TPR) repeat protein